MHRQHDVFGNGHLGCGTGAGVLKDAADEGRPAEFRPARNIAVIQKDAAPVRFKGTGHGIEQRTLSRAVGADDGGKGTFVKFEAHLAQRPHLIGCIGEKGFRQGFNFQHDAPLR